MKDKEIKKAGLGRDRRFTQYYWNINAIAL